MTERPTINLGPTDIGELRMFVDYFYDKRHVNGDLAQRSYVPPGQRRETWIKRCDMIGFSVEMAFARYLNVAYTLAADKLLANNYDVAGYEVRGTDLRRGSLITREFDKPGVYVLGLVDRVDYENYVITLAGWANWNETLVPGRERASNWYPCPAYYTPQTLLHPMDTLPTLN